MIIDDNAAIGNLEQEVLEREGYAVLRAYSGTEAQMLLENVRPSLILLDLMLPGLSGEEFLSQIKGIPVIVVSAKAAVQDKVNLLLGGAADYLTKPFDTKVLLARVAVRLREHTVSPMAAIYTYGDLALDTASHSVQKPTEGDYTLYGSKNTDVEIVRSCRRMGAVVESPSIYFDMTVQENTVSSVGCWGFRPMPELTNFCFSSVSVTQVKRKREIFRSVYASAARHCRGACRECGLFGAGRADKRT